MISESNSECVCAFRPHSCRGCLNFGLAPTTEPMATELLREGERMWREHPQMVFNEFCTNHVDLS